MRTMREEKWEAVKLLLDCGADDKKTDKFGKRLPVLLENYDFEVTRKTLPFGKELGPA